MSNADKDIFSSGDVVVDLGRGLVTKGGEPIQLTRTEWLLLQTLVHEAGRIVPAENLLGQVWGPQYHGDLQYLRVWISRLRQRVETNLRDPRVIVQDRLGFGFNSDN